MEEQLKGSFLRFIWYVWTRVLALPEPTRLQYDLARFISDGPRRRFIAAFRGIGKTFLTGAYIVWRLWRDPNLKIMVVSANERFAAKVAAFVHTLINAEDLVTREPVPWAELKARSHQKNSTMEFDVGPSSPSKDPSVFAVGINGQMAGGRADIILSDDVEVPNNSETEAQREKLVDRTGEYEAILKPDGEIIYLGTFQSMQSIYRKLRSKGFTMRIWPARYPLAKKAHIYEDNLAPILKEDLEKRPELAEPKYGSDLGGAPTDPQRFDIPDLIERETGWGRAGFTLQFMLDTSLSDAERFPLKTSNLIVMDTSPEMAPERVAWASGPDQVIKELENVGFDGDRLYRPIFVSKDQFQPYTGSVMDIDPSGGGQDETAFIVTKFLNGIVYVRKWGGRKDGHSEATLRHLAEVAKAEKVNLIRVESNFGDGMFSRLLEPYLRKVEYSVPIEDHKVTGQKEARILSLLQGPLEAHRIVLDRAVAEADIALARSAENLTRQEGRASAAEYSGLYQLTHLTNARGALRHDDRLEVLAHALGYWAQYMNADAEEVQRKREEKEIRDYERSIWQHSVTGRWDRKPTRRRGRGRRVRVR